MVDRHVLPGEKLHQTWQTRQVRNTQSVALNWLHDSDYRNFWNPERGCS